MGTCHCELTSNLPVRRRFVTATFLILMAGVFGLHSYRRFNSTPLPRATFSPKPPAPPKDCSNLRNALASSDLSSTQPNPVKNTMPLTPDEIAIYKAVIQEWISGRPMSLNVSSRTFSIRANLNSTALVKCACIVDIQPESLLSATHSYHQLTQGVLDGGKVRLVDPSKQAAIVHSNDPDNGMKRGKSTNAAVEEAFTNGLFSLSEIAFDTERKHALLSYSFVCGSLCGSGNTWVFEKVAGEWKRVNLSCGGWVS